MSGVLKAYGYDDLDRGLDRFLDWVSRMRISTSSTRFHHYRRSLTDLMEAWKTKDEEGARKRIDEFLNTLLEIHDLIQIHDGLAGRGFDDLLFSRLSEIAKGPIRYTAENASSSNRARNLAFELIIASRLAAAGLPLHQSGRSDLATIVNGKTILIECKRPQSASAIDSNIKDAYKQLKGRYGRPLSMRVRGMAAIDITKAFNPDFGAIPYDHPNRVGQWISNIIDRFADDHSLVVAGSGQRKTIGLIVRLCVMAQPVGIAERVIYA